MGNHLNKKNVELSLLSIQIGWRHIGCTQVFRVTVLREGLNDWRRLAYEVCHFTRRSNFDIVIKNYEVKKKKHAPNAKIHQIETKINNKCIK